MGTMASGLPSVQPLHVKCPRGADGGQPHPRLTLGRGLVRMGWGGPGPPVPELKRDTGYCRAGMSVPSAPPVPGVLGGGGLPGLRGAGRVRSSTEKSRSPRGPAAGKHRRTQMTSKHAAAGSRQAARALMSAQRGRRWPLGGGRSRGRRHPASPGGDGAGAARRSDPAQARGAPTRAGRTAGHPSPSSLLQLLLVKSALSNNQTSLGAPLNVKPFL